MAVRAGVREAFARGEHAFGKPVQPSLYFEYPEQDYLVQLVSDRVALLRRRALSAGDAAVVVTGERGCGKSATLQALAPAIETAYPDIIVTYADMRHVKAPEHPLGPAARSVTTGSF